jgi:hypothetical protein
MNQKKPLTEAQKSKRNAKSNAKKKAKKEAAQAKSPEYDANNPPPPPPGSPRPLISDNHHALDPPLSFMDLQISDRVFDWATDYRKPHALDHQLYFIVDYEEILESYVDQGVWSDRADERLFVFMVAVMEKLESRQVIREGKRVVAGITLSMLEVGALVLFCDILKRLFPQRTAENEAEGLYGAFDLATKELSSSAPGFELVHFNAEAVALYCLYTPRLPRPKCRSKLIPQPVSATEVDNENNSHDTTSKTTYETPEQEEDPSQYKVEPSQPPKPQEDIDSQTHLRTWATAFLPPDEIAHWAADPSDEITSDLAIRLAYEVIDTMNYRIEPVNKTLRVCIKHMSALFPSLKELEDLEKWEYARLDVAMAKIEGMIKEHGELAKKNEGLRRVIVEKDREIAGNTEDLMRARDSRNEHCRSNWMLLPPSMRTSKQSSTS